MTEPISYPAVVLAGGLGTRLRSAFRGGPKCLAPIGPHPFLDYVLGWLRKQGVMEVILCVGYRRSQIQRRYRAGRRWGIKVRYSVETEPLGTAGALRHAVNVIGSEAFFVLNGDTFLDLCLAEMSRFHQKRSALATLALVHVARTDRYGSVRTGPAGQIAGFEEKRTTERPRRRSGWINGGVYLLSKELLRGISFGKRVSLECEVFPGLIGNGLFGFKTRGYFIDIGTPEDYERAQLELPRGYAHVHPR